MDKLSISSNVINNYFKKIDFKDYEEFRQALRKIITLDLSTADRFQISKELHPKINNVLNHVISKDIESLHHLLHSIDEDIFAHIVEEILNAPEIILVATSASSLMAIYGEQIFNKIGKKTSKITSGGTENFTLMSTLDRNAIILCFGFARYPKDTIKILSFLKKRNFRIITITDDGNSPLVPFSYLSLPINCESVSFTDSFVAPMALLNTLAIAVSQLDESRFNSSLNIEYN